jgi:ATP-dependent Clp endopeptidase proteolytic subunit ClpP
MYGSISDWGRVRAEDFINKLADFKSKGYEKVKLKINSPGGSIFEGIAIMSQMGGQEMFIHGVVEGMAASMASAMLQGCHKRSMVKGGRLMVHQGSGGVFGSASFIRNYAELLESLNKTLAEIYAKRSKRSVEYILKEWMPEGKDTWFNAEQAFAEGLIDEVIEGSIKPLEKEQATLVEMAAHYNQFFDTKQNAMDKESKDKLIKALGLKAEATDAEILAAVEALEKTPPPAPPKEDPKDDGKKKLVDNAVALAKERGLAESKVDSFRKVAEVDIEAALALLPEKKAEESGKQATNLTELIEAFKKGGNTGGASADRASWDYDKWSKEDSKGLMALASGKPDEFAKLFQASFGYKPSPEEIANLVK